MCRVQTQRKTLEVGDLLSWVPVVQSLLVTSGLCCSAACASQSVGDSDVETCECCDLASLWDGGGGSGGAKEANGADNAVDCLLDQTAVLGDPAGYWYCSEEQTAETEECEACWIDATKGQRIFLHHAIDPQLTRHPP